MSPVDLHAAVRQIAGPGADPDRLRLADALAPWLHPARSDLHLLADLSQTALCHRADGVLWRSWGSGAPVVLLHGGAGNWTHWIRTIRPLAATHSVHVPDLPGFGASEPPDTERTFDAMATALLRSMPRAVNPGSGLVVAGFSFGSPVAARLARELAPRVTRVVIVGGNVADDAGPRKSNVSPWRKLQDPEQQLAALRQNLEAVMLAPSRHADDFALLCYITAVGLQRFDVRSLPAQASLRSVLAALPPRLDVNAIAGASDQVFAEVLAKQDVALRDLRPGTGAGAMQLPGAGHWVMYEAPEAFIAEMQRLLARA